MLRAPPFAAPAVVLRKHDSPEPGCLPCRRHASTSLTCISSSGSSQSRERIVAKHLCASAREDLEPSGETGGAQAYPSKPASEPVTPES